MQHVPMYTLMTFDPATGRAITALSPSAMPAFMTLLSRWNVVRVPRKRGDHAPRSSAAPRAK